MLIFTTRLGLVRLGFLLKIRLLGFIDINNLNWIGWGEIRTLGFIEP